LDLTREKENTLKKLGLTLAMIMSAGFAAAIPAQAGGLEVSSDIGAYSQYVWRGAQQGTGGASVQGDLGVSAAGFSASVWYATLGDSANNYMEYDLTLDYSGEAAGISYSVGVVRYAYTHGSAFGPATEVYLGGGFGPASVTVYRDTKSKDMWVDAGVDTEALGYGISATAGYALPSTGNGKKELRVVAVSLSKDFEVADGLSASPSLSYNAGLGANRVSQGGTGDQVVAGVNFSY